MDGLQSEPTKFERENGLIEDSNFTTLFAVVHFQQEGRAYRLDVKLALQSVVGLWKSSIKKSLAFIWLLSWLHNRPTNISLLGWPPAYGASRFHSISEHIRTLACKWRLTNEAFSILFGAPLMRCANH
ncbi:hypothetical protein M514_08107 [Trichuris suis]|uniref:Uncharacterized protein n=1 Tax=Trichuris suis TaxID=68888 RepID=A0A085M1H0_9BILA|nr:hypothetical protein M513_08107 [Trichuris suis]KFD73279.1 hypothetical protein M514_08107 [Trichuris suis]